MVHHLTKDKIITLEYIKKVMDSYEGDINPKELKKICYLNKDIVPSLVDKYLKEFEEAGVIEFTLAGNINYLMKKPKLEPVVNAEPDSVADDLLDSLEAETKSGD